MVAIPIGVAVLALLGLIGGLVWANVTVNAARDNERMQRLEADKQREAAEKNSQRAERNFGKAVKAVEQMLTEVGSLDLLHTPQAEVVRKNLLKRAQSFYREFLKEHGQAADVPPFRRPRLQPPGRHPRTTGRTRGRARCLRGRHRFTERVP